MANIELSAGLANSAARRVISAFKGSSNNRGYLYFMKGAAPLSLNSITNPAMYRVNDRLVRWNSAQTTVVNGFNISVSAAEAIRSGEATWFYWYRKTNTAAYQIAGTVSKVGDGGDIELPNTRIISGQTYNFDGLSVNFEKFYFYSLTTEVPAPSPSPAPPTPPASMVIDIYPKTATWYIQGSI